MSIFGRIASAIFGSSHAATVAPGAAAAAVAAGMALGGDGAPAAAGVAPAAATPISPAEVDGILKRLAADQSEQLNWHSSIVDLMKLLKLESALTARKELAQELGYGGALDGSAEMNIWLHKQVMTKLAESGGVVPQNLRT